MDCSKLPDTLCQLSTALHSSSAVTAVPKQKENGSAHQLHNPDPEDSGTPDISGVPSRRDRTRSAAQRSWTSLGPDRPGGPGLLEAAQQPFAPRTGGPREAQREDPNSEGRWRSASPPAPNIGKPRGSPALGPPSARKTPSLRQFRRWPRGAANEPQIHPSRWVTTSWKTIRYLSSKLTWNPRMDRWFRPCSEYQARWLWGSMWFLCRGVNYHMFH